MKLLLHPGYLLNIASFATMVQHDILWEMEDNYQKQTYRNRCYICTDQGKQMLNIPIQHVGGNLGRQKYKDVKLDNLYHWQRQHWRSLQTAYRTSPFFEFYEDEIAPLYTTEFDFLLDFNLMAIETICDCLQTNMPIEKTKIYEEIPTAIYDARFLISAKTNAPMQQEKYMQVFTDRNGFIGNVSVLDLMFNEGPNALEYLNNQNLDFLNA